MFGLCDYLSNLGPAGCRCQRKLVTYALLSSRQCRVWLLSNLSGSPGVSKF